MLRFGLIGCGRIGIRHARLLSDISGAELAAVCDIKAERAEKFAKEFNVPFYSDYLKMVETEHPDTVNICTPSGMHAEHAINCAGKVPNIICEKPMALKLADADRMIETCASKKSRLFIVKQNRFNLPIIKLREALDHGRFGKLYLATVRVHWRRMQDYYDMDDWHGTWAMDGGVLTNQASHHIDMLQWMLGPISNVFAMTDTMLHKIEVEDIGVALLKARSGAVGIIEATTNTSPEDLEGSINVYGENGTVEIGGFAMNRISTWKFDRMTDEDGRIATEFNQNPPDVYGFGHRAYLEHVIDGIVNNKQGLIDGFEARKSLEIITAIYESAETSRMITLPFTPSKCRLGR